MEERMMERRGVVMKKRMKWRPPFLFSVKTWQQGLHTRGMSLRKVTCSNLPINILGLFLLWTGWTSTTSPPRLNREIYHQSVRSDMFISSAIPASIWFVDRWSHTCSPTYRRSDYLCRDYTCTYAIYAMYENYALLHVYQSTYVLMLTLPPLKARYINAGLYQFQHMHPFQVQQLKSVYPGISQFSALKF